MNTDDRLPARPSNVTTLQLLPRYGDAHIAPGEYEAVLVGVTTWARRKDWAPRVVLVFTIAAGREIGTVVAGHYRALRLTEKPRRNGRFEISKQAKLYRELARMLGRVPPTDHIPDEVIGRRYRIVVRDVEHDGDEHPLEAARYSGVDWVIGCVA